MKNRCVQSEMHDRVKKTQGKKRKKRRDTLIDHLHDKLRQWPVYTDCVVIFFGFYFILPDIEYVFQLVSILRLEHIHA